MERVDDVFRLYCADLNVQSTLDFIIWDEYLLPRSCLLVPISTIIGLNKGQQV